MAKFLCDVAALFGAVDVFEAAIALMGKDAATAAPVPSESTWRRVIPPGTDNEVDAGFMALRPFLVRASEMNG
ncbi:hypothetical protein [Cupriavidus taiwanensis]|uniref:hypothetical protein n=1 Tax=Cupriavidus taiwanensis TaxID=164546 RepID=UPI000E2E53D8|nr:hypothetical protein [Cupriavidus taiwanensis]